MEADRQAELEELREELTKKSTLVSDDFGGLKSHPLLPFQINDQSVKIDDIGRALVVKDGQYNAVCRDRDDLVQRVRKLTDETNHIMQQYQNLQAEFKSIEETNRLVSEVT